LEKLKRGLSRQGLTT